MAIMLRITAALFTLLVLAAPAGAAQSFVYVAVAPLPCPGGVSCAGQLLVFDAATKELVTAVALGGAENVPRGMGIAPDGRRLYISLLASDGSASLAVFDTTRHEMGPTYPLPAGVAGPVAVTRDSLRVFVSGGGKLIVLERYDVDLARSLVQGCDVWLNTPLRPLEASGTSGMKAAANGALQLSVLDGWWAEAYDGTNGFAIGRGTSHVSDQISDQRDGADLYNVLENEVIPLYYERDVDGLPRGWIQRMKNSISSLAWRFSAHRMVMDYTKSAYLTAAGGLSCDMSIR